MGRVRCNRRAWGAVRDRRWLPDATSPRYSRPVIERQARDAGQRVGGSGEAMDVSGTVRLRTLPHEYNADTDQIFS